MRGGGKSSRVVRGSLGRRGRSVEVRKVEGRGVEGEVREIKDGNSRSWSRGKREVCERM